MNEMHDIEKFKWLCHKILPLAYDDSLSYYEFLCKVLAKLNEVITGINTQNNIIKEQDNDIKNFEEKGRHYKELVKKYGE